MPTKSQRGARDFCVPRKTSVLDDAPAAFIPLTSDEVRQAFALPSTLPPILSLEQAADLVHLRPQTLKRKVSEGLYGVSVVRGKPLRFWRDRLVQEVMR